MAMTPTTFSMVPSYTGNRVCWFSRYIWQKSFQGSLAFDPYDFRPGRHDFPHAPVAEVEHLLQQCGLAGLHGAGLGPRRYQAPDFFLVDFREFARNPHTFADHRCHPLQHPHCRGQSNARRLHWYGSGEGHFLRTVPGNGLGYSLSKDNQDQGYAECRCQRGPVVVAHPTHQEGRAQHRRSGIYQVVAQQHRGQQLVGDLNQPANPFGSGWPMRIKCIKRARGRAMKAVSEEEKRADSIRHTTSNINLDKSGISIVGRHLRKPRVA